MKFVLWFFLIFFIMLAVRKKIQTWQRNQNQQNCQRRADVNDDNAEAIVSCAYCGVYIPLSEAVKHVNNVNGDIVFCSMAHRQQYLSSNS